MARLEARPATAPRARRVTREHQIVYSMNCRWRSVVRRTGHDKGRKRPASELLAMLDLDGIRYTALRPVRTYFSRSADLRKQLFGLVEHLFVDRKSTRLNSSHRTISYAVFCLKKKKQS